MCCTWLAGNTGGRNNATNRYLRTIAQISRAISSQLKHVSTIGKPVKQQYLLQMSSQYGELRPTNGWDPLASLGHPSKFQRLSSLGFVTAATLSPEANQTLYDVWLSPALVHGIYIFGGSCPLTEFWPVRNSCYFQVLRSPTLATLLHGNPAEGISQTLRRGIRNGNTEVSQKTPPIFGWAAIALGIGPHSSYNSVLCGVVYDSCTQRYGHTCEQFLKLSVCVRFRFNLLHFFRFRILCLFFDAA